MQLELSERVYTTEVPRRFVREHEEIFEALAAGDGDRAADAMAAHLGAWPRRPAKALRDSIDATEKGEQ